MYKKAQGRTVVFMILYVDHILLIDNDVKVLSSIKIWLSTQFSMKDLEKHGILLGLRSLGTARIRN